MCVHTPSGYIEPLLEEDGSVAAKGFEFDNDLVGSNIPPEFHSSIEKGFKEAANAGALIGAPVEGVRVVLQVGEGFGWGGDPGSHMRKLWMG